MNKKLYLELFYQLHLAEQMKNKNLLSENEFQQIKERLLSHYPPEITFFFS